jgi:hypothetical protein
MNAERAWRRRQRKPHRGAADPTAANAQPALPSPEAAKGIALGLIDATGPLAVQCGLGKIGEKIKAKSVATAAVKDSLAISGAKKSCSGVKELAEAMNRPLRLDTTSGRRGIARLVGLTARRERRATSDCA